MNGDQQEIVFAAIGHLIFVVVLAGVVIAVGYAIDGRPKPRKFSRWPIGAGLIVAIFMTVGAFQRIDARMAELLRSKTSNNMIVQTVVAGPAVKIPKGLEGLDLTKFKIAGDTEALEIAKQLNQKLNARETFVNALETKSGETLIKIETFTDKSLFLMQIAGSSSGKAVTVLCVPRPSRNLVLRGSSCEQEVVKTFGNLTTPLQVEAHPSDG